MIGALSADGYSKGTARRRDFQRFLKKFVGRAGYERAEYGRQGSEILTIVDGLRPMGLRLDVVPDEAAELHPTRSGRFLKLYGPLTVKYDETKSDVRNYCTAAASVGVMFAPSPSDGANSQPEVKWRTLEELFCVVAGSTAPRPVTCPAWHSKEKPCHGVGNDVAIGSHRNGRMIIVSPNSISRHRLRERSCPFRGISRRRLLRGVHRTDCEWLVATAWSVLKNGRILAHRHGAIL